MTNIAILGISLFLTNSFDYPARIPGGVWNSNTCYTAELRYTSDHGGVCVVEGRYSPSPEIISPNLIIGMPFVTLNEGHEYFTNAANLVNTIRFPVPPWDEWIFRLRTAYPVLTENFASRQIPENWREWDGQVHAGTWNYSGSNAIAGHPSIGFSSGNPELAIGAFCGLGGAYNSLSVSFLFRANGTSLEVCDLYDPNGDEICDVYLVGSQQLVLQAGASNKSTSAIPLNTTLRVWIRYEAIAPGQSKASLAWALEGEAEPTSGPQCARNASAAYATPACKLLFGPVITDGVVFSYAALKVSQ